MDHRWWRHWTLEVDFDEHRSVPPGRLVADGGQGGTDDDPDDPDDDGETERTGDDDDSDDRGGEATDGTAADEKPEAARTRDQDRSNVEVTPAGETEPADPKWEKPDPDDIPEFEIRADEPLTRPTERSESADHTREGAPEDSTAGMPNVARSPGGGDSRIASEGTEGYVVAVELCARLPEDVRLPEQAADVVPAAVEAELEEDIQSFAAAEFDNPSPHVEVLEFVERDDEIWLRLRLGISPEAFADLDPAEIRSHALQELEGLL